jgi:NADPH-dependent F420 reductase
MTTKIAIIGAGNVGGNLGVTLSKAGFPVHFGVKEDAKKSSHALLERCEKDAVIESVEAAAKWGDVVFIAVPAQVAVDIARSLAAILKDKVVVDCNNSLQWDNGPVWAAPPEGSLAQAIARAVPGAKVVKGFNTFGAEFHADPKHAGVPANVFFASDDAGAKKTLTEIATKAGYAPVDAGPLRNAGVLENLAILWIHLAMVGGQGRDFTFVMTKK